MSDFMINKIIVYEFRQNYYTIIKYGHVECINGDINVECGLNGESFPDGNTVPNIDKIILYVCREYTSTYLI